MKSHTWLGQKIIKEGHSGAAFYNQLAPLFLILRHIGKVWGIVFRCTEVGRHPWGLWWVECGNGSYTETALQVQNQRLFQHQSRGEAKAWQTDDKVTRFLMCPWGKEKLSRPNQRTSYSKERDRRWSNMWILELMVVVEQSLCYEDQMSIIKKTTHLLLSIIKHQLNSMHKLSYLILPTT